MTKVSALDDVKALVEAAGFEAVEQGSLGRVGSVEMARWGKTEEQRYVIRARKAAE
jgi:hypothetical protein